VPSALVLFGRQVRILRNERRLSQEKLAELCAVHRNYIGRVERAETNVKFDSVIRLSVGLKVRPEQLFKLIPKQTLADADGIAQKDK
jgi:XRE family transcriptional regulator, regulator of sulfur utilization